MKFILTNCAKGRQHNLPSFIFTERNMIFNTGTVLTSTSIPLGRIQAFERLLQSLDIS